MMSEKIKYLVLTIIVALSILCFLVNIFPDSEKPGGFNRRIVKNFLKSQLVCRTKVDLTRVAGLTKDHIYLSTNNPWLLIDINIRFGSIKLIHLGKEATHLINPPFWVFVDSPLVRILVGNDRSIVSGTLRGDFFRRDSVNELNFSLGIPISNSTYLLRGPDNTYLDQFLKKYNEVLKTTVYEDNLIEKKKDGGLLTDGTVCHDDWTHWLIYIQYYTNSILCLDSNLNRTGLFHTIDTCAHYQIEIINQTGVTGKPSFALRGIPHYVNLACDAACGELYVHSMKRAENESPSDYAKHSVIDVYDLREQRYLYSFYIPKFEGKQIMSFRVVDDFIIALYERAVILFVKK
jgi:hypothetical protein